jgi:hypothetical protein
MVKKRNAPPTVLLVALVVIAPAVLSALAYASPPDPSWIRGIYDDADYDDVVVLVTSSTGDVAPAVLADSAPIPILAESLPQLAETLTLAFPSSSSHSRAPPAVRPVSSA